MKYLKLFDNNSGYTEYMEGDVAQPNVSYCIEENEAHYAENQVLPGNEEVWELYSSLVCDSARLDEDLRNIFSKYQVSTSPCSSTFRRSQDILYTDSGTRFSYSDGFNYECDILTSRAALDNSYALASVTNDCGQDVLPGGVGSWRIHAEQDSPVFE